MFFLLVALQKLTRREIPVRGSERSSITEWICDYMHEYGTRKRSNIGSSSDAFEVKDFKKYM